MRYTKTAAKNKKIGINSMYNEYLGSAKSDALKAAGAAAAAKAKAGQRAFSQNVSSAKQALLDAGYTQAQINSTGGGASAMRFAATNTDWVPNTAKKISPFVVYAALGIGAYGLFYVIKKKNRRKNKAA